MGMMDNMSDNAKDMMDDPDKRQQIEQMAKDRGISMEQAKQEYMRQNSGQ